MLVRISGFEMFKQFVKWCSTQGNVRSEVYVESNGKYRRIVELDGKDVAQERRLTKVMAFIPLSSRYKGDHLYVDEQLFATFIKESS